jgi:hypothetical protein
VGRPEGAENGERRFRKVKHGRWEAVFRRAPAKRKRQAKPTPEAACGVEKVLVDCGIKAGAENDTSAGSLARDFPQEKIERCVAHWNEENARRKRAGKDLFGTGYLVESIRNDEARGFVPEGFVTAEDIKAKREKERAKQAAAEREEAKRLKEQRERESKQRAVAVACYEKFNSAERELLENAAMKEKRLNSAMWKKGVEAERRESRFSFYRETTWARIAEWFEDARAEDVLAAMRTGEQPAANVVHRA